MLETAHAAEEVVKGIINGKVKGGFTVDVAGIRAFADVATYFTANISSPNTPGLRDLQQAAALDDLLAHGEGLTVAGARRKLEAIAPESLTAVEGFDEPETLEHSAPLGSDAQERLGRVKEGLLEIQAMLSSPLGFALTSQHASEVQSTNRSSRPSAVKTSGRSAGSKKSAAATTRARA